MKLSLLLKYSVLLFMILVLIFPTACSSETGTSTPSTDTSGTSIERAKPGEIRVTHINSPENGNIAVRIDVPNKARYPEGAPVVVVASTWFVDKYNNDEVEFHLVYNPVEIGVITITNLWPGKTDPTTKISSEGVYDYGGPNSLASLRDTIRFSLGEIPDIEGHYLHDLIDVNPLYDNVGMFASSHAGVVATNVMAYYGEAFPNLKYFVGRENPTMAEMYPLEIGHFNENHQAIYNPYYFYEGYTPTSIEVDYSHLVWIQNAEYPEGRPYHEVPNGIDYVLDDKGPNINGKRYFSHALTQALLDNGVFTADDWPDDVATPAETDNFWPYRITIHNYEAIGEKLPELRVILVFATDDHVQTAQDKPHIRQAYDGFRKRAGLWTRLNCDLIYIQSEIHSSASIEDGFPDNVANTEPQYWHTDATTWGFAGKLAGVLTARTIPLAGIAEMADRVQADIWSPNLDTLVGNPQK
ncbi:hypothetical protein ACFLUH_01185 [Chloroflexota bacterium]